MGGANSWVIPTNFEQAWNDLQKRMANQERRPSVREASDLLGPGFTGPFSTLVQDWNSDETSFNGYFYSLSGSVNSPDDALEWLGMTTATSDGRGIQRMWEIAEGKSDTLQYQRSFWAQPGGARTYTPWALVGGRIQRDLPHTVASGWSVTYAYVVESGQTVSIAFAVERTGAAIPSAGNGNITNSNILVISDPALRPILLSNWTTTNNGMLKGGCIYADGTVTITVTVPNQGVATGENFAAGATYVKAGI